VICINTNGPRVPSSSSSLSLSFGLNSNAFCLLLARAVAETSFVHVAWDERGYVGCCCSVWQPLSKWLPKPNSSSPADFRSVSNRRGRISNQFSRGFFLRRTWSLVYYAWRWRHYMSFVTDSGVVVDGRLFHGAVLTSRYWRLPCFSAQIKNNK